MPLELRCAPRAGRSRRGSRSRSSPPTPRRTSWRCRLAAHRVLRRVSDARGATQHPERSGRGGDRRAQRGGRRDPARGPAATGAAGAARVRAAALQRVHAGRAPRVRDRLGQRRGRGDRRRAAAASCAAWRSARWPARLSTPPGGGCGSRSAPRRPRSRWSTSASRGGRGCCGPCGPPFLVHDVGFSPSGRRVWLTAGRAPTLAIYDADGRGLVRTLGADLAPQHIAFGPSHAYVASGEGRSLHVHSLARRAPAARHARADRLLQRPARRRRRILTPSLNTGALTILDRHGHVRAGPRVARAAHDACVVRYAYTPSSHALSAASRAAASTPSANRCALIPTTPP